MYKTLLSLGFGMILLISSCTSPESSSTSRLTMYIGSQVQDAMFTHSKADKNGDLYYLASDPIIIDQDIARTYKSATQFGTYAVGIELNDHGRNALTQNPAMYVNRDLVILWDNHIISAPTIMTPLGSRLVIVGDLNADNNDEVLHEIAEYLKVLTESKSNQ